MCTHQKRGEEMQTQHKERGLSSKMDERSQGAGVASRWSQRRKETTIRWVGSEQYNVGGYRCFCIYRSTGREGSHIRAKSHRSPSILSSYSLPTRESEREPWTSATTGRGAPIASSTCRSAGSANAATHRSKF